MKKYNFDEIIDRRNTNALNTDGFREYIFHAGLEKVFPFEDEEFIRMWVADMEFPTPPEICEAIRERVDRRIFGYSMITDSGYYKALMNWCTKRYDWSFKKEELVFSPGVIPALYQLLEDLVEKDEKVLTMTPAYGYFGHAAEYNHAALVCTQLKNNHGYFTIDFDDFERKAADPKVKVLIFCNPHNPTGRIWTKEELKRVAEIVKKYKLWIISDEIHCDLVRQGLQYTPMGKIMPRYQKLVICISASKTFNMAGLMLSNILIRDREEREKFVSRDKIAGFLNPLSIAAHKAAYEECNEWLEQLKTYLDANFCYVKEYLDKFLPEAVFSIPQATYLAWIDTSRCLPEVRDFPSFFAYNAGVLLEGGNSLFVGNAEGYIRLNLAMPRSVIKTGLERMYHAIQNYNRSNEK